MIPERRGFYDQLRKRYFPEGCKGILDVTKEPYYLDNTGKEDCTEALVRILNDILADNIVEMKKVYDALVALPGDSTVLLNTRELRDHELPQRNSPWYYVPLYSGRGK